MKPKSVRERPMEIAAGAAQSGCPGCCVEAQADGVPCGEIGNCEKCGRAIRLYQDLYASATAP